MEHTNEDHARAVAARFARMKWRRPLRAAGGAFAAAVGALVLVGFAPFDQRKDGVAVFAPGQVLVNGSVESLESQAVGSPFSGMVARMDVQRGDRVQKGQILFRMDLAPFEAELATAKAERNSAWMAYKEARAQRDQEGSQLRRQAAALEAELARERSRARAAREAAPASETEGFDGSEGTEGESEAVSFAEPVDLARISELEEQVNAIRQQLREHGREWNSSLWPLWQSYEASGREVARIQRLIAGGVRRSPIAGTVTDVRAVQGTWVEGRQPVVRVDDPEGYRVMALVDRGLREKVEPGVRLPVRMGIHRVGGKLEKVVDGWDRELFKYYLYVKPERPEVLHPGQTVEVGLPSEATLVASR